MKSEELHKFLFQLYDYADYLTDKIQPDNRDNDQYFMSLVFIERMMDGYGRSLATDAARDTGDHALNPDETHLKTNQRINQLRQRIREEPSLAKVPPCFSSRCSLCLCG